MRGAPSLSLSLSLSLSPSLSVSPSLSLSWLPVSSMAISALAVCQTTRPREETRGGGESDGQEKIKHIRCKPFSFNVIYTKAGWDKSPGLVPPGGPNKRLSRRIIRDDLRVLRHTICNTNPNLFC